jgi:hypothetical protein
MNLEYFSKIFDSKHTPINRNYKERTNMTQKRTFTLNLKNDQTIVLEFSPIAATGDRLWQMFATTEALDTVDQIVGMTNESSSIARTELPAKSSVVENKTAKNKKSK